MHGHKLCDFSSLVGPIPIIYLTMTPNHDLSSLSFWRNLLSNRSSNGDLHFFSLLDCNECSNYAEGDEGDFLIIEKVIGSHTLHFTVSFPPLLFRHSHGPMVTNLLLGRK